MRKAAHSGTWYPNEAEGLSKQIEEWIGDGIPHLGQTRVLIVPHAGYRYSGSIAATAYSQVDPKSVNRAFILGPCHRQYVEGCALPELGCKEYETTFGPLPLDSETIRELFSQSESPFRTFPLMNDEEEHSIEMQLPILRYIFRANPALKIVPIYVGSIVQNEEGLYGRTLAKYFDDPGSLFIVSSDFCHWGHRFRFTPREFPQNEFPPAVYPMDSMNGRIESLDRQGMCLIERQDIEGFSKYLNASGNTICGRNCILLLLRILQQSQFKIRIKFLKYMQSGLVRSNPSRDESSVSYAAAVGVIECL